MEKIDRVYRIESSKINQDKMNFIVINRTPVKVDRYVQDYIEQELYNIFKKYA